MTRAKLPPRAVAALAGAIGAFAVLIGLGPPIAGGLVGSETLAPTYVVGDRVWVRRWGPYRPRRGDVVTLPAPPAAERPGAGFIKRVAGLEGETVQVARGVLVVDDAVIDEPWRNLTDGPGPDHGPIRVPAGHVYLLGDARAISYDSRHWGTVPASDLDGPVVWPRR